MNRLHGDMFGTMFKGNMMKNSIDKFKDIMRHLIIASSLLALLAACGGGTKGGVEGLQTVGPTPLVCNAPMDLTIEATGAKTTPGADELGEPSSEGFDSSTLRFTHDIPTTGLDVAENPVTWSCLDDAGNGKTAPRKQIVTILDTTPPVITLPSDPASVYAIVGTAKTAVDTGTASAKDLVSNSTDISLSNNAPLDGYAVGETLVSWTARDKSGNEASGIQTIKVLPYAPQNIKVTGVGTEEITLSWDAIAGVNQYTVYWTSQEIHNQLPTKGDGSTQEETVQGASFTHVGRAENSVYYYVISATGTAGEGQVSGSGADPGTVVSQRTLLGAPDVVVSACYRSATLTWNNNDATRYDLKWSNADNLTVTKTESNVTSPYEHDDLRRDIDYHYQLIAYNKEGVEGPAGSKTVKNINGYCELEVFQEKYDNGDAGPEMVIVPGGRYNMGGDSTGVRGTTERPIHDVTISPFALGKYEVTFDDYDRYLSAKEKEGLTSPWSPGDSGWRRGTRPVISVSWDDITLYLIWLNDALGLANSASRYRLPTEAEWEWAARSRQDENVVYTEYPWGNDIDKDKANCFEVACGDAFTDLTAPVGSFVANAFGLHDMHGNVWEWVEDCWHDNYDAAPDDGSAWLLEGSGDCSRRVLRGGSWKAAPARLRSAGRNRDFTGIRFYNVGFRLARTL